MGRPKGSVNKIAIGPSLGNLKVEVLSEPTPEFHYDAIFGVRCHRKGIWKGQNLWELTRLDNNLKRNVLIDATDRKSIMNMIIRYIGKIVVVA